jgi:hypothetical protein
MWTLWVGLPTNCTGDYFPTIDMTFFQRDCQIVWHVQKTTPGQKLSGEPGDIIRTNPFDLVIFALTSIKWGGHKWRMWIDGWKHIMVVKKCFYKYYFVKLIWLSTSTKSILKEVFINYIQNKVVQLPNNKIVKRNKNYLLILNH